MSEKSELKPCAHCGCAKVIIIDREVARHIDHELFLLEIRCTDCTANIQCYGSKLGDSLAESIRRVREHLIAAWNRRAAPEPSQEDREMARQWGFNNSLLESQIVDLAAEFARVRAEERERVMPERMAKALAEFHEWGRTTAISLSPQEHELYDAYAAAIRGSR